MNLMPSVAAPVERTTPATAAAQIQASLPIPPLFYPCEAGAQASINFVLWPCESGAQASLFLPPLFMFPCE